MKAIRIVLVDDHVILRDGIKSSLKDQKNIKIVGEASNGKQGLEVVKKNLPDIVMIDINMPEMNGLQLFKLIKTNYPHIKCMVLSMHEEEEYVLTAIKAGVEGYVVKDSGRQELIKAINLVYKGDKYFSNTVSNILANKYLKNDDKKMEAPNLTKRELVILKQIIEGSNNQEISEKLKISIRTVETHRFNIMKKLKVKNGIELVKVAMVEKMI